MNCIPEEWDKVRVFMEDGETVVETDPNCGLIPKKIIVIMRIKTGISAIMLVKVPKARKKLARMMIVMMPRGEEN